MVSKHSQPPSGLHERTPKWHFDRFVEFTDYKHDVGEPSPHLAIVGYFAKNKPVNTKLWMLGCYAATYCLPTAQVLWTLFPYEKIRETSPKELERWLTENWKGIVTRTERRCVRTPKKMTECLASFVQWVEHGYQPLTKLKKGDFSRENYDVVWESVSEIKYFGRYINIRFVEGLKRFLNIPANLYDIRSIGGWSPKRALCYLYPEHTAALLLDTKESNELTDQLANELLERCRKRLPWINEYILAAMMCEYKAAFENYKQYPGWTIDQEPLMYDKVYAYWGDQIDKTQLWKARKALFPKEVLGELNGWNGTRWNLTETIRDNGYVWSDLKYVYNKTVDLSKPVKR